MHKFELIALLLLIYFLYFVRLPLLIFSSMFSGIKSAANGTLVSFESIGASLSKYCTSFIFRHLYVNEYFSIKIGTHFWMTRRRHSWLFHHFFVSSRRIRCLGCIQQCTRPSCFPLRLRPSTLLSWSPPPLPAVRGLHLQVSLSLRAWSTSA